MNIDSNRLSPFSTAEAALYARWRDLKLEVAATRIEELLVEIRDLANPSQAEKGAIIERCRHNNMAIYCGPPQLGDQPEIPLQLGRAFGLMRLDHNWLGDDNGLTSLRVRSQGTRKHYIPYTNRPIRWHTDGYYNSPENQIRGMLLHCVHSADEGGSNGLHDPELAYIHLREQNPGYIDALMEADAMTIPIREGEDGSVRREQSGPVFSIDEQGQLHMRFTERQRNITWKKDPLLLEAVEQLKSHLASNNTHILRGLLQPGMGLICNNVLHDRSGFDGDNSASPRLLYRGRYCERIQGTGFETLIG
jgi:hypothetical protein